MSSIDIILNQLGLDRESAPSQNEWEQLLDNLDKELDKKDDLIAESEALKLAATDANQAKSMYLANMSHELRTPLAAIIGYGELLYDQAEVLGVTQNLGQYLNKIGVSANHLLSLINDILDLSKIEAGKIELNEETFTIQSLIEETLVTMTPVIEKNNNRLKVESHSDGPLGFMHTDPVRLRQILINILSNAAKFTHNGDINLKVQRKRISVQPPVAMKNMVGWMTFIISDNGIGMSQAELNQLFQPFQQASGDTATHFGGTGLGLAISQHFCQLMGGHIEVHSEKDVGTTFIIEIPIIESDIETPTDSSIYRLKQIQAEDGQGTILIIDDDQMTRNIIAHYLMQAGMNVELVSNGQEGLKLAKKIKPQAIILDIFMPSMDGWQVLQALKEDPDLAEIPVILATVDDLKQRGFALGASDYLQKPIKRETLLKTIKKYSPTTGPLDILVVEDNDQMRDTIKALIDVGNLEVREAPNGREALSLIAYSVPDLILLDLMMPEMNGFELIEQLKSNPLWKEIPIIVISAIDLSSEDRQKLSGAVRKFIRKTKINRQQLLDLIFNFVQQEVTVVY